MALEMESSMISSVGSSSLYSSLFQTTSSKNTGGTSLAQLLASLESSEANGPLAQSGVMQQASTTSSTGTSSSPPASTLSESTLLQLLAQAQGQGSTTGGADSCNTAQYALKAL